jgi:hypothetical protein
MIKVTAAGNLADPRIQQTTANILDWFVGR